MATINVRQIQAKSPTHKSTALLFDAAGNPVPGLVSEDYLDAALVAKLAKSNDFSKEIKDWDTDIVNVPTSVSVPPFTADAFNGLLDTAIYADVHMGSLYDKDAVLKFRYVYQLPGPLTDEVQLQLSYQFFESTAAIGEAYTHIVDAFNPDGTDSIRTGIIQIPAQVGLTTTPLVTLRLTRLGASDTNAEDFNLISTELYQE